MERKCVLVVGNTGQLARCLADEADRFPLLQLQCIGSSDLDVTNTEQVREWLSPSDGRLTPNAIINTAAFHDLRACESDFDTALRVNALGVANLLSAMPDGCHLYHLSTDYVFDGEELMSAPSDPDILSPLSALDIPLVFVPYRTSDACCAANNYGRTKRAGELIALDSGRATVIRTASLFSKYGSTGKGGSNFLLGMLKRASELSQGWLDFEERQTGGVWVQRRDGKAILQDELIAVDSDVVMAPTYTPWLARAILYLVTNFDERKPPSICHIVCDGPPVSWFDFARAIFTVGADPAFNPVDESVPLFKDALDRMVPKAADNWPPRPHFSALENSLSGVKVGTWKRALEHFFLYEWPAMKEAQDAEARQVG